MSRHLSAIGQTFSPGKKIPHMGWNTLHLQASEYWQHLPPNPDVYFVHSYYAETGNDTLATAHHGETFSAALARDNFFATQFHPEKSGAPGQQILKNFLRS
jgi:glutamine amidotransferase